MPNFFYCVASTPARARAITTEKAGIFFETVAQSVAKSVAKTDATKP
jgi:hypothetical protein